MDKLPKIAVLDDYQKVAYQFADWSQVEKRAIVTFFDDHLFDEEQIIERLKPFVIICVMRERTPLTKNILSQLPNLKLVVSTGKRNASINMEAAAQYGITIAPTGYHNSGAPELTWALLMCIARNIVAENNALRDGEWQQTVGTDLYGKTIGIIGLGNIGGKIASYAKVFGMNVIAWSENLTAKKAANAGAELVSKETLFANADFVTVHLVLSDRSRGIISAKDLKLMKPTAYLINTSRGPLINENDLIEILTEKKIAGAALDVFDEEPLADEHPFRNLDNVLCTPHIGYVTNDTYKIFYEDTVKIILDCLNKK
jgi:phosphoglycerate dehydrogenase-like enzyme